MHATGCCAQDDIGSIRAEFKTPPNASRTSSNLSSASAPAPLLHLLATNTRGSSTDGPLLSSKLWDGLREEWKAMMGGKGGREGGYLDEGSEQQQVRRH
jgi:hypothetical protein